MAFPSDEQLIELITPIADGHRMDVETMKVTRAGKKSMVVIGLDSDTRPSLDELEVLSQEISELLDTAEEAGRYSFGAGYTLEVSTPGVELPFTAPRHWRRNRTRLVKLAQNGVDSIWRIGALSDDGTAVILVGRNKEQPVILNLELTETYSAVVEIEFAKPPVTELELAGLNFEDALKRGEEDK
ncbi:ribosome maturation factor RimP [Corynebacterium sp. A21]|uniref:ribosome maturation factor RimP n=1 Tax=Corynebacterium sp. A21 TaxID=3457318 RepID=UPI003FD6B57B